MASTVTIKQRVSLENGGRTLRVTQTQNGQTRSKAIDLKEPARNLRQLHNITDYAASWPSTEVRVTDGDIKINDGSETT
jgi:hypothetical protein